jgi:hypothetical protein
MIEFLEALSECVESVVVWGIRKGVLGNEGFHFDEKEEKVFF